MKTKILLALPAATLVVGNAFAADTARPAQLQEVVVSALKIDTSQPMGATQINDADLTGLRPDTSDIIRHHDLRVELTTARDRGVPPAAEWRPTKGRIAARSGGRQP